MVTRIVNNQSWDCDGNLVSDEWFDLPYEPLDSIGVMATLNCVLGLWSLTDAANAANCEPDHLISEAQSWAMFTDAPQGAWTGWTYIDGVWTAPPDQELPDTV